MTMTKKLIIAIVVLLVIIGGIYAYIRFFPDTKIPAIFNNPSFPPTTNVPPTNTPNTTATTTTQEDQGELSILISEPSIGATLSRDGKNILYLRRDNGNIYRTGFDGQEKTRISNTTIVGIYKAQWSPQKTKVFLSYAPQNSPKKLILNVAFGTSTSSIIPESIRSLAWSQDEKTTYLVDETTTGARVISANSLGKNGKELLKIPLGDLEILPVAGTSLFLTERPSGIAPGPLFQLNLNTGTLKELARGFGLTALPSIKGTNVLISKTSSNGLIDALTVLQVNNLAETRINLSALAEKCVWQNESILFCGIPIGLPAGIYPDDYYKGAVDLNDQLIKIDLSKSSATAYSVVGYDMQDLFVDADGSNVFFRDQRTDFIYRFTLPKK